MKILVRELHEKGVQNFEDAVTVTHMIALCDTNTINDTHQLTSLLLENMRISIRCRPHRRCRPRRHKLDYDHCAKEFNGLETSRI